MLNRIKRVEYIYKIYFVSIYIPFTIMSREAAEIQTTKMSKKVGIMDPEGHHNNPLTNQPYSDQYKTLGQKWSNLPAYKVREDFVELVRQNQVIILTSGTGSGKTVLVPKYVLHALNYTGNVITTMPKTVVRKERNK